MRKWFHVVARQSHLRVFILNVPSAYIGTAALTEAAGCRWRFGAFCWMLISETEYWLQVEEDIKPFRDVLPWVIFVKRRQA